MKKIFTISLILFCTIKMQAQNIGFSDLPVIGEAWIEYIDTTGGSVSLTPPGTGQTWNYSSSFSVNDTSGGQFIAPNLLFGLPFFSGSTMGINDIDNNGDSSSLHFKSAPSGLYLDGFYTSNPDTLAGSPLNAFDFNPDRLFFPTPFSIGSQRMHQSKFTIEYLDTVNFPSPTPVRIIAGFYQDFEADASGSLTTPLGTFANVLRVRETTMEDDSIYIYQSIGPLGTWVFLTNNVSDTTISYSFVKSGPHMLLMTADVDPVTTDVISASYYDPAVLVGLQNQNSNTAELYPNPVEAGQNVYFNNSNAQVAQFKLYDLTGNLISREITQKQNGFLLNTELLPGGLYFVQGLTEAGEVVSTTKLTIK